MRDPHDGDGIGRLLARGLQLKVVVNSAFDERNPTDNPQSRRSDMSYEPQTFYSPRALRRALPVVATLACVFVLPSLAAAQLAERTADLGVLASGERAKLRATPVEDCDQIGAPSPVVPALAASLRSGDSVSRDDGLSDLVTLSSSGCPEGVWLDDFEDVDYGPDTIGVTWCRYTSSHTITLGASWPLAATITLTICVYSGCDLTLTEEEANSGGS